MHWHSTRYDFLVPNMKSPSEWPRPVTPAAIIMEKPRILIADDQADILEALQLLLKNEGFAIHIASSPRAVIDALKTHTFEILLLDLNYARDTTSGGEGLELLAEIQQLDDAPPVVLMTAWGSIELAVQAMHTGGCDFIQKPWDNKKLLDLLRRHVEEGRALGVKRRQERKSNFLVREMQEACEIQQRLLPSELPKIVGCALQAAWHPAHDVGGDYYDAVRLSETAVALCIGDVSGKGLPAALLMSNAQATVRALAHRTKSPAEICGQINRAVAENMPPGKFITFFYGVLDSAQRTLRYTSAGHLPPVLVRRDGSTMRLDQGGTVLGIFSDAVYTEDQVILEPGDRVVLLTDGITEAFKSNGEEYGEDRLIDLLVANRGVSGDKLMQMILDAVASFADQGLQDDATLMIVSI